MSGNLEHAPLRLLCLDVGGTLLEERIPRWGIYAEIGAAQGLPSTPDEMRELMREAHVSLPRELDGAFRYSDPWFEAFIRRIFGERLGGSAQQVAEITEEAFRRFETAETFRLFPGVRGFLDRLRERGVRLAVVSNWSARLPHVLEAVGIADRFDAVLCSALEGTEKPDPELFLRAMERLGIEPRATRHVGDQPRYDVVGARAAGIEPVWIRHSGPEGPPGYDDVLRVGSFAELEEALLPHLP